MSCSVFLSYCRSGRSVMLFSEIAIVDVLCSSAAVAGVITPRTPRRISILLKPIMLR